MAFQQLRLLLWKNWLTVIRQPVWSLILIIWPLIIFIIIAVTRIQFPPIAKETCYVGPRNLPSTGFFPFLQTLMCNTDSNCHNKSRLWDPNVSTSRAYTDIPGERLLPEGSPLASLFEGGNLSQIHLPKDLDHDPVVLVNLLSNILGTPDQARPTNASLTRITLLSDQWNLSSLLESVSQLKRAICTLTLPLMNLTSHDPLTFSVVNFCKTNDTALEVSLLTLNQILTDWTKTNPDEVVAMARVGLLVINHLQKETLLWESLLAIPQLFSSGSVDQVLASMEGLVISIEGAMNEIERNITEAGASFSTGRSLLAAGFALVHYVQNWPGKGVFISLRDVVALKNGSFGGLMMLIDFQIPLDKAIGLAMDKSMVRSHLCDNSSNPLWLKTACSTGTVDMLLDWISPEKMAKQILLAWSKDVAQHDLSFAKRLVHILMGGSSPENYNYMRGRRSIDTQPQNIEEELFLEVGKVVLEIVKLVPEVDVVIQSILRTGFQSLMTGTLALDTVEEMMDNVLKDAMNLQWIYLTLMTNQSVASVWIDHFLDSLLEVALKTLRYEHLTCKNILEPLEWLLNTKSIDIEVWRSVICQNSSTLEQALLRDLLPLIQKAQAVYEAVTGHTDFNVTLPMILSEWHKLYNSSMEFGLVLNRLVTELGEAYLMNWMQVSSTQEVIGTLQQSVLSSMVNLGGKIETSELWPSVKNYFHMLYWISNYRPGVTTQQVNCSVDIFTLVLNCDTGLNWTQFVQTVAQALLSPNQDFVTNGLKGTLNFLQHVYGDIYKHHSVTFLNQKLSQGGDALSGYLITVMINLDSFLQYVSILNDSRISNPDVIAPALSVLLESAGLELMLPLFLSDSPLNISTVLDIATKIGRQNQNFLTFNETDPTLPELERLILHFLSMEGNLTIVLPHIMGHSLLTYSDYFHPDLVAELRKAIQPFTNKTSKGAIEAILSAMELLKTVTDARNGDPVVIILGYIRQFQELVMSLFRLRTFKQLVLPSGQLTAEQVTDLHLISKDFLNLLTPEVLQNLTQAGPDAAQTAVIQKFVAFLPSEVQERAAVFLHDFKSLQHEMAKCATGQDCLAGVSEILNFLDQIFEMMLSANGSVTINVAATNRLLERLEYEELATVWFSLLLAPKDSAAVQTFRQVLHLVKLLMTTPNISVSDVQNALRQSNLTFEELNDFAALAGAANINNLMGNIIEIINTRKCFELQHDLNVTALCALGLINGVSTFLTHVPELRNQTAFLSLIPSIVNATFEDVMQPDFSSDPYMGFVNTLNITLANIKLSLQLNHLNTPEIMKEIRVVERLMQLITNMEPVNNINITMMQDTVYAQKIYLQIAQWYLNKLEEVTRNSSISNLFQPFFHMTQMQVTLQLAQTNFSLFVSNQVESLINSLEHPIDGVGVSKIGLTVVEILRHLVDIVKFNLEVQSKATGLEYMCNTTILNAVEAQIKQYLNLIENWMKQPNVPLVLTNMLQWGNPSINISVPLTDIQNLLQTMVHFLSDDEQAYLSVISNITHSLKKALRVAQQPGGLQSNHFLDSIFAAVQPLQMLIPLPPHLQQKIMDIVEGSLQLINLSDMRAPSYIATILNRIDSLVQEIIPDRFAVFLVPGLKIATTYFESISMVSGPDNFNQIILNEMKTIQSLLPPNCTAHAYISAVINITQFILMSGQGNMSLWASFQSASLDNVLMIIDQLGKLESPESPHSVVLSLKLFAHLSPFLNQVINGQVDLQMWHRLEKMLESLLLSIEGTELIHNISSVVPLLEKTIGGVVNNMKAGNVMILSLQLPVVTLMTNAVLSVNSSHVNLFEVMEGIEFAIEHTLQAAQQTNCTLECNKALNAWEPVRQAAGLSSEIMYMWCNISLQPVLEAYAEALTVNSHLDIAVMAHMGVEPMTVNATAARIVKIIQSLYQVTLNQTRVTKQLIMAVSDHLSMLVGRPLSPEAQHHWYKQLQDMQLQNSLSSIEMVSKELRNVAPFLHPYIEPVEEALIFIVNNSHLLYNSSSSEELFKHVAMILLSSVNISSGDIFMIWEDFSTLNEAFITNMLREVVKLMTELKILGEEPMVYQVLEQFLMLNDTGLLIKKVTDLSAWLTSTEASAVELLMQVLPKMFDILRCVLSLLNKMSVELPADKELFEDLFGNIIAMLRQFARTSGPPPPMGQHHGMFLPENTYSNHTMRSRHRREAPVMPPRDPMDDFIDLFFIDYPAMFTAFSVSPSTVEIMETFHMFFGNPDLNVVLKGATSGMQWDLKTTQEETINAALGMLSFVTLPGVFEMSSLDFLVNAVHMIPDNFPFSLLLKDITRALANTSEENLLLMEQTFQTITELFQINLTDLRFKEKLGQLQTQMCALENTEPVHQLLRYLSIKRGQLCHTIVPSLQSLFEILTTNTTALADAMFQTFIGDPKTYHVQANWTSVLAESLGFNTSSLHSLNINITSPGVVTIGEMLRNKTAFVLDVHRYMDFAPAVLGLLMNTTVPNNNLEILSWLVSLHQCNSTEYMGMKMTNVTLLRTFCSMCTKQWYSFLVLMVRHLNIEKFIYRVVLSEDLQSLAAVMLEMAEVVVDVMNKILPTIRHLQTYLFSISELKTESNNEFSLMTRGQTSSNSNHATFVTLSRALCSKGIIALFGISKLTTTSQSSPSSLNNHQREEMIERFKIPRNATPFCMNMYLDMVNTTGGAIAWAFLKPMLMGQILFTPDTPVTRSIMEKANTTLQEFANMRKYSQEWIESSNYIVNSAETLSQSLPILQNSLSNSFVKNFIQMQTDINVDRMRETLNNFSNITVMLEKNKQILNQITTLSNLMVDLSSCIQFDRYHGYDSEEQLNAAAQELAKNRNLYASVIFKLPKDNDSSRKRQTRSSSTTSSLPPYVSYTIRMHMDNVMRTDRVRNPYFVKDTHIVASMTMRYNRGFIYLQENIDRAIIETHAGRRVTEPGVQLQPFPYPCYLRDEYLEAISFVFPIMLMLAWVLFVADFVKKLVHERELRLHEYMKMMGVSPVSHFFAWFLECATYLLLTIFVLTLVMKYGKILPNSDGFLLFLYFCDYGLSILAFSYLVSSFFDRTYIAGLSGSLLYILCFFPFIVVMALETNLSFSLKSILSLFSPTCFSHASQYVSRYEAQGEGIQWRNSYTSPMAGDTASFGWLCWLMLIDSILYFVIGAYIRMVFPGKYGIPAPWYFPFKSSFWADVCCCIHSKTGLGKGFLFTNVMQKNQPVLSDDKGKGQNALSFQTGEDFSELPVGVILHGLSKIYGNRVAIQNLNLSFYEGHVTSLLGHNGAGKTTTMSLLTGLFAPSAGTIEVYGRDMQKNIDDIRKELGVCMQYDVLFDHMTTKEHLLLYGQIKAPHWSRGVLHEQVRTILEETGMYAHRHKRVGTLSGGMKRKLSISIAFIGGSRLVVLDEPTTGVDPCSRRSIWDIVIQHKKHCTIIMSTHHLDEAEVLSDRIAFLEKGRLKCCGSPFYLKDKLGQGYKLTLTKKKLNLESEELDGAELKEFIQAHVPEARLKETQGSDLVYLLPTFTSSNASSFHSLLMALDSNLDSLHLGGYGISDTTLEEVFLELTHENSDSENVPLSISETVSDTGSLDSFPSDPTENLSDRIKLTSSTTVSGMALAWQQISAILIKRFQHSCRDWKGLISQILLPVMFVVFAMGLGSIKNDLQHYPEMVLSPALYNIGPSYSFFRNHNPTSRPMVDAMMSFPGIDNACLDKPDDSICTRTTNRWTSKGNTSKLLNTCKCTSQGQVCDKSKDQLSHKMSPSSQVVYNLSGINVENYLVNTANNFIRNRYGGFEFGMQLPPDLQMDLRQVPKNRTLSKVWFNPEGHHTMPAYMNSLNNLILRTNLPADKDPRKYAISVSSHPYFGRADDEDAIVQGMLQMLVAMCVLTGFSITTSSFALYEVSEHHSGAKRLQHIAGISEPLYWAVNFFYDMVVYLVPVAFTVCVIAAFQIPAFTERQNLGAITLLFTLFGFATFPWMYLLSGVFKDAEMAFITYVCINLFISINTIISTSILYFLGQISPHNTELIKDMFDKMCSAFLIFPQFNFGNGVMHLTRMNIEVQILSGYGIDAYQNPFSTYAFKRMFIASFIQGLVFFTLRLLLNKFLMRKVRRLICGKTQLPQVTCENEDEDVAAEHLRVSSGAASSDILQVSQLTKVYQHLKKKVPAVKRLSVGITAGECFGLLGVNGAGKTTTFKMLTGDISPTEGTAHIRDWDGQLVDIMECRYKGINIGYCPQVDALDNLLTGEEHMYFYARIRGISKREIDRVVTYLLRRLELDYHRNIITDGYSCGTRRKLSTALALLGHPQILLLDEPSSGMDPRTKRHLWKIISEEVKGKCAVVLTSHSMEECEALCSRLAIMVKGQFRCLGSLQHIKNRFGSGFTVKMYLAEASYDAEAITGFMQCKFPSTYLKDQHSTMVEYHVPVAPGGVANIFNQLESNKTALQIKHFSVSQTTLDEVFINFAMGKIGMDTIPVDDKGDDLDLLETVET